MYYWNCKRDGSIELHLNRYAIGKDGEHTGCGNAWYFLNDQLAGKYNYVTMVKAENEEIFVWHKNMKEST